LSIKTFYRCSNNCVIALVTEEVFEQIEQWRDRRMRGVEGEPYPGPIFTFLAGSDEAPKWMVGNQDLMRRLTADCMVVTAEFSVPFSNSEMYGGDSLRIKQVMEKLMPSVAQIIEAFGLIVPAEVNAVIKDGETYLPSDLTRPVISA
jgi:hypothetical protein